MALVAYSDSEGSDNETSPPIPKPSSPEPAASAATSKPAFRKVVDRANPQKIRVNLPSVSADEDVHASDANDNAPPAKRPRVGGGAFSGFNSFLPAPKKTGQASGEKGGGRKLGVGIRLKTGATPAFSREPMPEPKAAEDTDTAEPATKPESTNAPAPSPITPAAPEPAKSAPKPMFRPLSVASKKQKARKGPVVPPPSQLTQETTENVSAPASIEQKAPPPKPKVSLFSISQEDTSATVISTSTGGDYQPLLYQTSEETNTQQEHADWSENYSIDPSAAQAPPANTISDGPHSLQTIAQDLNLTEAQRRQLFGRRRKGEPEVDLSAINVVNFNTDEEYAHNEALRASGETIQHNPVRAIAPGKHSLKQLVSAASTQKEALEEHFATGYRNRKEAGNKYGW